jgi:hypothetical protein
MQQTAVEWLALRYHHRQGYLSLEDIAKAKEMEKEQIIEAFDIGTNDEHRIGKEYFNQTFKQ